MSRSSPSLIALLGLAAVAGYQHRGKLAEMLNKSRGSAGTTTAGGTGAEQPGILSGLAGMFGISGTESGEPRGGLAGGLTELMDRFRSAGKGDTADSWVASGVNAPLAEAEVEHAIGDETIAELVQKTGLSRAEILQRLSIALPETVDTLTPDGHIPAQDDTAAQDDMFPRADTPRMA